VLRLRDQLPHAARLFLDHFQEPVALASQVVDLVRQLAALGFRHAFRSLSFPVKTELPVAIGCSHLDFLLAQWVEDVSDPMIALIGRAPLV
jgi:hypothetical protein